MARPKPLAELIDVALGPALAAQGFAASDVILSWPEIVGERLARFSQPMRIDWPRRGASRQRDERAEPASLVVRVESAFALEMQHIAAIVIERVNGYYGWRCIGRLVLKQGPVRRPVPAAPPVRSLDPAAAAALAAATDGIAEEPLRGAVTRLGEAVLLDSGAA